MSMLKKIKVKYSLLQEMIFTSLTRDRFLQPLQLHFNENNAQTFQLQSSVRCDINYLNDGEVTKYDGV